MNQFIQAILAVLKGLLSSLPTPTQSTAETAVKKPSLGVSGKISSVGSTKLIREFEGLELTAYTDIVGVWTIGYGHTKTAERGMVITQKGAEALLRHDLDWVEKAINKGVKTPLTQNQYDALASLIYNVGATAFSKSTILRRLNAEDYVGASSEFKRWNKAGGRVVNGLTRRRKAEQELFDE